MSEIRWQPGDPRDRSILGFRVRNGGPRGPMCASTYYKLRNAGRGPRETILGGRIIISVKDEQAWLEAKANPNETEARLNALAAERRREKARRAAAAALKSPRHPANVRRAKRLAAEAM